MAMEVVCTIASAHEASICAIALNRAKHEAATAADGDRAIKVWDIKNGTLLRTQTVHKGGVTSLAYAPGPRLLFSGSIDGSIACWTDKGQLLQVVPLGSPVFSLAWGSKHRILVAGGNSVLHLFKVDMADVLTLKHARHSVQPTSRQAAGMPQPDTGAAAATAPPAAAGSSPDAPQVLRCVCPAFKGWRQHARPGLGAVNSSESQARKEGARVTQELEDDFADLSAAAARFSDTGATGAAAAAAAAAAEAAEPPAAAPSVLGAESEAAASASQASNKAGKAAGVYAAGRSREEDSNGLCHTDVVKCICITDSGKIYTAGFDRCICAYDVDKLDKPREAFRRTRDCGRAGLTSLAFDSHNNVLLAGSLDGALRVWSVEGRCLDKFEGLGSNSPIAVAHLPHVNHWWATGRGGKLAALDPRAPGLITEYVAQPNQLEHAVELLLAPPGTDLVLAGTSRRQLVVWQFNPHGAHRVFGAHSDWVEGLLVSGSDAGDPGSGRALFSYDAAGHVYSWQLDAEQNCDVFRVVDDAAVCKCNVLCMLHLVARHCVVCGCEDGVIRLHYLDGHAPASSGDGGALPTVLQGHDGKVVGLASLPDDLLLSAGEDRSLRVWDLATMKQLHVELDAHDSPIQCLEHCPARAEVATCAMDCKAKVWSLAKPSQPRLALLLDHSDPATRAAAAQQQQQQGAADVNAGGRSNMQWLTRSDLDGLGAQPTQQQQQEQKGSSSLPAIVAEAIAHAADGVPEVTQVRWVPYAQCWVTAADDELLRTWSTGGVKTGELAFKGGSCRYLFVDAANELLVVATNDKAASVFSLAAGPVPLARFEGHTDVISCIGYLPALDCYVTSSWDCQLRLWRRPQPAAAGGSAGSSRAASAGRGEAAALLWAEDSEEDAPSEYEKAHPLVLPSALAQGDHTLALLRAVAGGAGDASKGASRRGSRPGDDGSLAAEPAEPPGSLGAKLQALGRKLLQDINETACKEVAAKGASAWAAAPGLQGAAGLQRSASGRSTISTARHLKGAAAASRRERQ